MQPGLHLGHRVFGLVVGAFVILSTAIVGAQAEPGHNRDKVNPEDAAQFIQLTAEEALAVLGDIGMSKEERATEVEALIGRSFNLKYVSLLALGPYRRHVENEELETYHALFTKFMISKYAGMLNVYAGQDIVVSNAYRVGQRDAIVETHIETNGQAPVEAEWRVRIFAGVPKIIDVKIAGLSLAHAQREEFGLVIDRSGFVGLMDVLRHGAAQNDRA